jgi:hypothetical protein
MNNVDPISAADLRMAQMQPASSARINMDEMQELLRFLMVLREQDDARRLVEKFNKEHNSNFSKEISFNVIIDQLERNLNEIHLKFFKIETDAAGFPKGIFE